MFRFFSTVSRRWPPAAAKRSNCSKISPCCATGRFCSIHPGFGISTPWSYQNLARFPKALNGQRGRAQKLISLLQSGSDGLQPAGFKSIAAEFYNSLEAPAFDKFPVLTLFQEFLRENDALAALMSGSGSTTFALVENVAAGESLVEKFKSKFGQNCWTAVTKI